MVLRLLECATDLLRWRVPVLCCTFWQALPVAAEPAGSAANGWPTLSLIGLSLPVTDAAGAVSWLAVSGVRRLVSGGLSCESQGLLCQPTSVGRGRGLGPAQ